MYILRIIIFFFTVFFLSELVVVSGVSWSFLESSLSSFSFLKIASDNRARDTIVSLAKASEPRMKPSGYKELDQTFFRMRDVSLDDPDGFKILEIVLTDPQGEVLAKSNESLSADKYKNEIFTRAFRMRKWQYPDTIILDNNWDNSTTSVDNQYWFYQLIEPMIDSYFPEAKENIGLVSSAVYHETKLDVVGAVHLVYSRGNFAKFLEKQKELLYWMLITYSLVVLALSVALTLVYMLFSYFQTKNNSLPQKIVENNAPKPPILEKVVEKIPGSAIAEVSIEQSRIEPVSDEEKLEPTQKTNTAQVYKTSNHIATTVAKPILSDHKNNQKIVVDAIYMGDYGD